MCKAEGLRPVLFPQGKKIPSWTLEGVRWGLTGPWESPEATGRVCELKRLWLLLLIPHKPLLVHAQAGVFFLSMPFLLNRVPLICLKSPLPLPALQCFSFSFTSMSLPSLPSSF